MFFTGAKQKPLPRYKLVGEMTRILEDLFAVHLPWSGGSVGLEVEIAVLGCKFNQATAAAQRDELLTAIRAATDLHKHFTAALAVLHASATAKAKVKNPSRRRVAI